MNADDPAPTGASLPINDVVHQRHRLAILTVAAEAASVEFTYLQDALGLTAGNLSRHIAVLAEAKLVKIEKGYQGSRPRTWISLTRSGRRELELEMDALRALVARHDRRGPVG